MPYKRYPWFKRTRPAKPPARATVRGRASIWFDATLVEEVFQWEEEANLVATYDPKRFDFGRTNNYLVDGDGVGASAPKISGK